MSEGVVVQEPDTNEETVFRQIELEEILIDISEHEEPVEVLVKSSVPILKEGKPIIAEVEQNNSGEVIISESEAAEFKNLNLKILV